PLHGLPAHRQRHSARRWRRCDRWRGRSTRGPGAGRALAGRRSIGREPSVGGSGTRGRAPAMTTSSPVLPTLVGARVKRREDPRLIQGRGTYVDDVKLAGMQHVTFKRSDVAHGRIVSIDTSAAEAMDGVEAVYTGRQIAEMLKPLPIGTPFPSPEHRAVAVDTVRFAGEAVAVVVAADRYVARDAADAI